MIVTILNPENAHMRSVVYNVQASSLERSLKTGLNVNEEDINIK